MSPLVQRWLATTASVRAAAGLGPGEELAWPHCQERGQVLRHNGLHGVFQDLTAVGAAEGCWLSDCTKTDKFVCRSPGACASACAQVPECRFWTYEPGITKCFLRSSDAGREPSGDFVSGPVECRPAVDAAAEAAAAGAGAQPASSGAARVRLPFAQAALWAAGLPALRACDGGVGAPGCDNPYAAMGAWRYAVNNLRMAVAGLSGAEREQQPAVVQAVEQVAADVASFYRQPTSETFQVAVGNALAVFSALRDWLREAPAVEVEVAGGTPRRPEGAAARGAAAAEVRLSNGREMPLVGFGTWQLLGQGAYDSTLAALAAGYRHIDTAQAYSNEREVGAAIRDSGVPREDVFLATKISDPAEFGQLERRFEAQLADLGTDYLDLYMLHSPGGREANEAAWRGMERLHDRGAVRSLGVSNFGAAELLELLSFARVKPVYLQNKFSVYSPGEQQVGDVAILALAREHGIQVMGYSVINPWPLMLPPMEDPHVQAVAARCGRSPAQVLHRWALQLGVAVIPKSGTPARIAENLRVADFDLSELDMRLLSGLVVLSESMEGKLSPPWADDVYGFGAQLGTAAV